MAVTKDDVLEYLAKANMIEIGELVNDIKDKFGVEVAAPPVAVAAPGAAPAAGDGAAAAAEEKTEFDVKLTSAGEKKIQVIKVLREVTDLGLKEAKEMVDQAPVVVKEGMSKQDAEGIKGKFEAAGASVEVE